MVANQRLWPRLVVLAVIVLLAISGIAEARGLYADGTYFVFKILNTGHPFLCGHYRIFVELLTQAPLLAALSLGVTDFSALVRIHSFGLIGIYLLLWTAALALQLRTRAFWLLTAAFAATYLTSGLFSIGESQSCFALSALAMSLLTLHRPLSAALSCFLVLAALLLVCSYEAMIFIGPLLAATALWRLFTTKPALFERSVLCVAPLLFLAGCGVAVCSVLYPFDAGTFGDAMSFWSLLSRGQVQLCLLAIALLFISPIVRGRWLAGGMVAIVALACVTFVCWRSAWLLPVEHYAVRVLCCLLLFPPLLMMALDFALPQRAWRFWTLADFPTAAISALLFAALLVPFTFQTIKFYQWSRLYEHTVDHATQTVSIDDTPMGTPSHFTGFNWGWNNRCLSFMLRPAGSTSFIEHSRSYHGWEPCQPDELPAPGTWRYTKTHDIF